MFLQRLQLTNVRSIEHLDLSFEAMQHDEKPNPGGVRKWTLLLGENGTGKSTILRSIALLVSGSEAMSELLVRPDDWIRLGQQECHLAADLRTAEGEVRHISLHLRRGETIRDVFKRNATTMDAIDAAIGHSVRNYFTVGYGAHRRLASNPTLSFANIFQHPRAQNVSTLFSADAVLNPLDTWAMNVEYRRKAGLNTLRNALTDLLPGVTLSRIDRDRGELLFQTQDGELPLDQLSDGYQNMAAWCGDLLYRITESFDNYRNPLAARGLLLIDEVDLHLHPAWQRPLKQFLDTKLPHFQILATTHSPITAQQAGENELYTLERSQPHASPTLEAISGTPHDLMLHQVLLSSAFGLKTLDSQHVEEMRNEYQALQAKSRLNKAEKRRHKELTQELSDLPDWSTQTVHDQEELSLLEKINSALSSKNGGK